MVSSSAPQPQPPSAEEEALRRNTDCVYFLASPLTCKKGSECEYRHSDIARVNPRDCWFWLNGNCLNPKCGFRHPPLDGLLGTQTPTSSGTSAQVASNVTAPAAHTTNASTRQVAACIYFQKGFCLKGDWCPFLHGPNPLGNKASLVTGTAASAAEPPAATKKVFSGNENSLQEKRAVPMNAAKSVGDSQLVKPITEVKPAPRGNDFAMNRKVPQSSSNADFTSYRPSPVVSNGNPVSWPSCVQQSHLLEESESMYAKDTEEVSREHSPGFDVLVDGEGRDSDYYPGEDRYGMSIERKARNEYDMDHSTDYDMIAAVNDKRYGGSLGYDSHDLRTGGQHAWEQHRASSERISGGSYLERTLFDRPDSHGRVNESDLRHRLAKHRNSDGLRSVISREHARDIPGGDRSYHKDELREKSLSNRLQGRLRLPQRSSSPVRAGISSHQGSIRNRIKGRVEEATFNDGGKNHKGMHSRKDAAGDNTINFAGPKSLAELKNRKNAEPIKQQVTDQQSLGKRKHLMLDGHQQSGSDLSFEGPKPLEEILKRKRGETSRNIRASNSSDNQGIAEDENHEGKDSTKNKVRKATPAHTTDAEDSRQAAPTFPDQPIPSKPEARDALPTEHQLDQETEAHEHREGESDYDQAGGEDFDFCDGENGDGSGEYIDEEDDDDEFAKKMGVMYS